MAYEVDRCVVISVHQLFSGEVLRGIGAWMVRTLNAQFCRAPDCAPCTVFWDGLVSQYCFSPLLERHFCRSLTAILPEQSKFRELFVAYLTAYCEPVART